MKKFACSLLLGFFAHPLFANCPDLSGTYDVTESQNTNLTLFGKARSFTPGEVVLTVSQKACDEIAFAYQFTLPAHEQGQFLYSVRFLGYGGTLKADGTSVNQRIKMDKYTRYESTEVFDATSLESQLQVTMASEQGNPQDDTTMPAGIQRTSLNADGSLCIDSTVPDGNSKVFAKKR